MFNPGQRVHRSSVPAQTFFQTTRRPHVYLETLGALEGLLPEPAQRLARPPLLRLGPVGLAPGLRELLAGLRQLGFQPPDRILQLPLSRVGGVGGTVGFSHGPFGRNDFLAVTAFPLGTGLSRRGFLGFRSWRRRGRRAAEAEAGPVRGAD